MVDTSQSRLAYIAESTYGTTPASPVFKNMRFLSESIKPGIQYISSNEIRPDRNVPDLTQVGSDAGGSFDFEMSYGSFDDMIEALLQGTWTTNVLKNGVTPKSFTFEKFFEAGATDQYHRYTGCRINTMSLSMKANQQVTGSFGIMAKGMASAQAIISGATYTSANTNPIMNAASNFASLAITGVSSPSIMALNLNITNNMRQQPVIGSINSKGIGSGRFVVTGDIEAYFEDASMIDLYLGNTSTDLLFDIGGASSLKYRFDMGKIKFSDAEIINGGNDQDVMAKMSFQAYYDGTDAATLTITRTP